MNKEIKELAKIVIEASFHAGEGHIPSSLSILNILNILYNEKLLGSDHNFILSKGHASLALYAILEKKGYLEKGETNTFCKFTSRLGGHPDRNKIPGVIVSSGSLGHGLPIAVGVAKSKKIKNLDNEHVYCLIGDGESNEGSIWESLLLSSHHRLNNLTVILDHNKSGNRAINIDSMFDKAKSFGFEAIEIDGHNDDEIRTALNQKNTTKPIFIVANTIKGKGIKNIENNPAWHHRAPTKEELQLMIEGLT